MSDAKTGFPGHGIDAGNGDDRFTHMNKPQEAAVKAIFGRGHTLANDKGTKANVSDVAGEYKGKGLSPMKLVGRAHAGNLPLLGKSNPEHEIQTGMPEGSVDGRYKPRGF
jgi:hypothetical protein